MYSCHFIKMKMGINLNWKVFFNSVEAKTIPSFIYPSIKNLINYEAKKEYVESVTQIKNLNLNF